MRSVIYGAAVSLDGFIAGIDDETDWLRWSDDVAEVSNATLAGADTILMGRRTYEAAVAAGLRSYPGFRNVVFSRTLDAGAYPEVEVIATDAVAWVEDLRRRTGKDVVLMGGGELARSLVAAGLVDAIGVNVQPIILGGGVPLLPAIGRRVSLSLRETKVLSGGCVYALYSVHHDGDAR